MKEKFGFEVATNCVITYLLYGKTDVINNFYSRYVKAKNWSRGLNKESAVSNR